MSKPTELVYTVRADRLEFYEIPGVGKADRNVCVFKNGMNDTFQLCSCKVPSDAAPVGYLLLPGVSPPLHTEGILDSHGEKVHRNINSLRRKN